MISLDKKKSNQIQNLSRNRFHHCIIEYQGFKKHFSVLFLTENVPWVYRYKGGWDTEVINITNHLDFGGLSAQI